MFPNLKGTRYTSKTTEKERADTKRLDETEYLEDELLDVDVDEFPDIYRTGRSC